VSDGLSEIGQQFLGLLQCQFRIFYNLNPVGSSQPAKASAAGRENRHFDYAQYKPIWRAR